METYAVLDDSSERTIILSQAIQQLQLSRQSEILQLLLHLRTVQQEVVELHGASVNVYISPLHQPAMKYKISQAFTAISLSLADYSYPVAAIQKRYEHLKGLPPVDRV